MPCRTYSDDEIAIEQSKEDKLTKLLCEATRIIVDAGLGKKMGKKLSRWRKDHEEMDRRRLKAEKAERRKQKLAARALNKLSPRERKALGFPDDEWLKDFFNPRRR